MDQEREREVGGERHDCFAFSLGGCGCADQSGPTSIKMERLFPHSSSPLSSSQSNGINLQPTHGVPYVPEKKTAFLV